MKNIRHSIQRIFVVAMVLSTLVLGGCVQKQSVVHSTVLYPAENAQVQLESIPDMSTPLAAPKVVPSDEAETITLVCDYQPE